MLALFTGLGSLASAQSVVLTTSPASPVTYGQPLTLTVTTFGDPNCGGYVVLFNGTVPNGANGEYDKFGSAYLALTVPAPLWQCIAILPPNLLTSSIPAGTSKLSASVYPGPDTAALGTPPSANCSLTRRP